MEAQEISCGTLLGEPFDPEHVVHAAIDAQNLHSERVGTHKAVVMLSSYMEETSSTVLVLELYNVKIPAAHPAFSPFCTLVSTTPLISAPRRQAAANPRSTLAQSNPKAFRTRLQAAVGGKQVSFATVEYSSVPSFFHTLMNFGTDEIARTPPATLVPI